MLINNRLSNKGVTLIELIMVIVIVGVLTSVSSMYIKETVELWRFLNFRNEVVAQTRMSLMRMVREIRQVKDKNSIRVATAAQISFDDINGNALDYQLSGNNLIRNSRILASGVTSLAFTYYNVNNNIIATPVVYPNQTDIRRIKIALTVASGTQSKVLGTQVFPRNFY